MPATAPPPGTDTLTPLVQRVRRLYSLPAVAMEALRITDDPTFDPATLRECIERDPALTGRILRVVNSSLFGFSRQIGDLGQAISILGVRALKLLVLGFSLPKELFEGAQADALAHYWRRTLTKAVAARDLATRCWKIEGDEAFLVGLMQDIGQLALVQELGEPYIEFMQQVRAQKGLLLESELTTLGFDHAVLSARLMDHWGLPERIVSLVALPLTADVIAKAPPEMKAVAEVTLAAEYAAQTLVDQRETSVQPLVASLAQSPAPDQPGLETLVNEWQENVEQLASALCLTLPNRLGYADLLIAAHARMSELDFSPFSLGVSPFSLGDGPGVRVSQSGPIAIHHGGFTHPSPGTCFPKGERNDAAACAPRPARSSRPDPALSGQLAAAVAACRHARCPLSLLMVQIDAYDDHILTRGLEGATDLTNLLARMIEAEAADEIRCLLVADGRHAVILEAYDRREAVTLSRDIVDAVRRWSKSQPRGFTVSVGAATVETPARNFPPLDLASAALKCLENARSFGGDGVKSIDIY